MAVSDRIAVMSEGAVVQEGTAEDLYHRPASEFVAQFIGRVNLLTGRVAAAIGDEVEVEVAGRRHRVADVPRREGRLPGARGRRDPPGDALQRGVGGHVRPRADGGAPPP